MGEWRYYTQRATTGLWLDTDTQLQDVALEWVLSGPSAGEAKIPLGLNNHYLGADGRAVWGKWDTMLFAEENGDLAWCGICNAAQPTQEGLDLSFIGVSGWLQRIPFNDVLRVWRTNAFEVARRLINHSATYPNPITFNTGRNLSEFTVGDEQPPPKPKRPPRKKGEKKSEWKDSKRYKQWEKDTQEWEKKYSKRERFEVVWWEAPYVGEELDSLAKEVGFDYRERVRWADKGKLKPEFFIDLNDHFANRRQDIKLVDGHNLAVPLDTEDADTDYANRVIGLGAGEGRDMVRAVVGGDDGRLYQAEFVQYKSVRNKQRLRALARADHRRLSNLEPNVDTVTAWDMPGSAPLSSLRCGDEVEVIAPNHRPPIATWQRVVAISRNPVESTVVLGLENA